MIDYFHLNMDAEQLLNLSSLGLAHLGDGVYELMVRSWLCLHGKATARNLHRATVGYVAAPAQALRAERILPLLTQPWGVSDRHRPGGPVRLALSPGPDRPAQPALLHHDGGGAVTRPTCDINEVIPCLWTRCA